MMEGPPKIPPIFKEKKIMRANSRTERAARDNAGIS